MGIRACLVLVFGMALSAAGCEGGEPREERPGPPTTARTEAAEEKPRWPRGPSELRVSLEVVWALEEGPVVCRVHLHNVSRTPLKYATSMFEKGAFCRLEAEGKVKKVSDLPCIICGCVGPYEEEIRPGQTVSKTFDLHKTYAALPPGKARVRFGWRVYRSAEIANLRGDHSDLLKLLFKLEDSRELPILPATEANLRPVLSALEREFAGLAAGEKGCEDYIWVSHDPTADIVATVAACRHREFVPMLFREMDRLPGSMFRGHLVGTVYESFPSPDEGFQTLARYLCSAYPAAAADVFEYWTAEDMAHLYKWEFMPTKRHPDTRLTPGQFARLLGIDNVWVRALLYGHYPEKCPDGWVKKLLLDLRRAGQPPARFQELVGRLDDDRFAVREEATRELIENAGFYNWYLKDLETGNPSAEVRHRLRHIREEVGEPEFPRLWQRTIRSLASSSKAQAQKVLGVLLAQNPPGAITRAARQAVDEAREHHK
jgi:hypothetical protein